MVCIAVVFGGGGYTHVMHGHSRLTREGGEGEEKERG